MVALNSRPVTVVVPTVKGGGLLAGLLDSLARDNDVIDRVIIVANSAGCTIPEPGSLRVTTMVLRPGSNLGYAGGVALGLRHAVSPYVLLCNDDVEFAPGAVQTLFEAIDDHPQLASVGPLVPRWDDTSRIDTAGIAMSALFFPSDLFSGERVGSVEDDRRIFGVSGCAGLYRREAVNAIGGVRGELFMFMEDVDLAWRLRAGRMEARLITRARARHRGSVSARRGSYLKNYFLGRNRWLIWRSNLPLSGLLVRLPGLVLADLVLGVGQALVDRNVGGLRGRIRGMFGRPLVARSAQWAHWERDFTQPVAASVRRHVRRVRELLQPFGEHALGITRSSCRSSATRPRWWLFAAAAANSTTTYCSRPRPRDRSPSAGT